MLSEEQVRMEIAAIEVQERGEAILVRARARNQASSDTQLAQKMAEEYAYAVEEAKAQQDADEAMARSMVRTEVREERQKRRGADRKCPSEELKDHVEAESERKLGCEARGDEYVLIHVSYMEDEEENGTGQLRMTEARERTEQYVQRMVTTEVEKKRKRQHEPPSFVEEGVCVICCETIPRAERVYSGCCNKMVCKVCFGR